ncbi:MAG: hypothetical protein QOF60_2960 [Actinomycetota bacterium]|nr:hypothetical protein [Actinomycetota bacterium]
MSRSSKQALVGMAGFLVVLFTIAFVSARANHTHGLRVDVLSARRAEPGDTIPVTISVRDTEGRVEAVRVDFGDGRVETQAVPNAACATPLSQDVDLTHHFDFTGVSTVTARVTTGGCGAATETVEAIRTIEIRRVRR